MATPRRQNETGQVNVNTSFHETQHGTNAGTAKVEPEGKPPRGRGFFLWSKSLQSVCKPHSQPPTALGGPAAHGAHGTGLVVHPGPEMPAGWSSWGSFGFRVPICCHRAWQPGVLSKGWSPDKRPLVQRWSLTEGPSGWGLGAEFSLGNRPHVPPERAQQGSTRARQDPSKPEPLVGF